MSSASRKKYHEELTRKLHVKAPDEKLYFVAEELLSARKSCAEEEEKKEISNELQRVEGILWERHRQLKFWIATLIKKKGSQNEIKAFIERKRKCLATINQIRESLGKDPYGYSS